ncbi:MAG: hypothetical protein WAK48_21880 [Candidatus Acidiferrum sp.]|jgi:hypothetical protein
MDQVGAAQVQLKPGEYDAIVTMRAFRTLSRRVKVAANQGEELQFVLHVDGCPPGCPIQSEIPDADKLLDATIRVLDKSGAIIPDAQIKLIPDSLVRAPKNPKTDERGELRVQLFPGTYYLFAVEP